jgi:hypothetical protein
LLPEEVLIYKNVPAEPYVARERPAKNPEIFA